MRKVREYINERYPRWLDYAQYHCAQKGIPDEAYDVLNEVLVSLLKRDQKWLNEMCSIDSTYGGYKQIDIYVLRMIRLNVFSPTSPYQNRYKSIPASDVDFSRLNIADEESHSDDRPAEILGKMHLVREAFESLDLSEKARKVFEHRFFLGLPFSQWNGPEGKKELYDIYNAVIGLIKQKINGWSLF